VAPRASQRRLRRQDRHLGLGDPAEGVVGVAGGVGIARVVEGHLAEQPWPAGRVVGPGGGLGASTGGPGPLLDLTPEAVVDVARGPGATPAGHGLDRFAEIVERRRGRPRIRITGGSHDRPGPSARLPPRHPGLGDRRGPASRVEGVGGVDSGIRVAGDPSGTVVDRAVL